MDLFPFSPGHCAIKEGNRVKMWRELPDLQTENTEQKCHVSGCHGFFGPEFLRLLGELCSADPSKRPRGHETNVSAVAKSEAPRRSEKPRTSSNQD